MSLDTVKKFFKDKKKNKAQTEELEKMKKYYTALRMGTAFVQAVQKDLAERKNVMNRHQRRRFEKSLVKGEFSPELVEYYKHNIDAILHNIEEKLTAPKIVDGAKLYNDAKKKAGNK